MIRMSIAGMAGFILVFFEGFIVMKLKGYSSFDFGGITPFVSVWAMNFFLLFSILTQIKLWQEERQTSKEEAPLKR